MLAHVAPSMGRWGSAVGCRVLGHVAVGKAAAGCRRYLGSHKKRGYPCGQAPGRQCSR